MSNSDCQSVSAKRKSTSVVLISLEFFSILPTFDIFSVLDGRVVFVNLLVEQEVLTLPEHLRLRSLLVF
jgi:hypothetical protein